MPPLIQNAFDKIQSGLECGFYTQFCRIEQDGVLCRLQRRHGATAVAFVAAADEFTNTRDVSDDYDKGKKQFDFVLLPEGRALGLTPADVGEQLRDAFFGSLAMRMLRGTNEIEVRVKLPEGYPSLDSIAAELGQSTSAIQRSLAFEGLSYKDRSQRSWLRVVSW